MKEKKLDFLRIDGLSNFIRVDSIILKVFWLFLFSCLASVCLYFLIIVSLTFAKFQMTTTYRLQTSTKVAFPTITLCSQYIIQLLQQTNTNVRNDEAFNNFLTLESAYKNMTGKYLNEEQKIALFDWGGFIVSCTFDGKVNPKDSFWSLLFGILSRLSRVPSSENRPRHTIIDYEIVRRFA